MAEIHNLPTKSTEPGLYLLKLIPASRQALFVFQVSDTERIMFQIHEDGGLRDVEGQRFTEGGVLELVCEESILNVSPALEAQALRITQAEFRSWDDMRIHDRVSLQIAWAQDALNRAELDLIKLMGLPYTVQDNGRWEYASLHAHIEAIQQLHGELAGLYEALSSL